MTVNDKGCKRDHDLAAWRRDVEETKRTGDDYRYKLCWGGTDMELDAKVQSISNQMALDFGCTLNKVAKTAMLPYVELPEYNEKVKSFKLNVLKYIADAIITNTNPVNNKSLGKTGVTKYVVESIIRYLRSGRKTPPTITIQATLTRGQITCLRSILDHSIRIQTKYHEPGDDVHLRSVIDMRNKLINRRINDMLEGQW